MTERNMARRKARINVEAGQSGQFRWAPPAELIALVGMLFGADYLLTGDWGFADPAVHPLWLPVLLISAQYGLGWGLAAAALCAASALQVAGGTGFEQLPLEGMEAVGPQAAAWLLAAVIVGTFRDRSQRQAAEAVSAMTELRSERDLLEADAAALRKANDEMRLALARGAP
jgi:hypothetical protein